MRASKLYNDFNKSGHLSQLAKQHGLDNLSQCIQFFRNLPYGRNSNRHDLNLVFTENRGTCSSKHAVLKAIALEQDIEAVQLILCIYKMQAQNTPGIGSHIEDHGLSYIPEAHCYLRIEDVRVDITSPTASIDRIANDILHEEKIKPAQVNQYKVDFHKNYLKEWIKREQIDLPFESVWKVREKCIASLSQNNI